MTKDSNTNVQVFVRLRPFDPNELDDRKKGPCFQVSANEIIENESVTNGKLRFEFDYVFGSQAMNNDVYEKVAKHVVDSCLNGYNGVIFAYGQTSSGKTHSILGYDNDPGLIPMSVRHVFDHIKSSRREWLLRVSYIEVYNEQLHDLLNPSTPSTKLVIFEDEMGHTQVKNLQEEIARSEQDVIDFLKKGNHNRHVSATAMNERSSRSHAVFTMIIESKEIETTADEFRFSVGDRKSMKGKGSAVTVSCLYMVDLAGSERSDKTQATGKTLGEGAFINKSLLNLSKCITQLSKSGQKKSFISYRDSKLTRLIRIGLGGNSKLSVLCCITPGLSHYQESISTMRFGQSARMIQNKSTINQIKDESALLKQYKREIEELKAKLERGTSLGHENNESLVQELEKHREERQELEKALKEITQLILVGDVTSEQMATQSDSFTEEINDHNDEFVIKQHPIQLEIDDDKVNSLSDSEIDRNMSNSYLASPMELHLKIQHHRSISTLSDQLSESDYSPISIFQTGKQDSKNIAANFKDQIKLLKETISDLRADKANHEKQRQAWEQERRQYEAQRLDWEKEKVVLQRENKFIEEERERLRKKLLDKGLSTQRNVHNRFEIRNGCNNRMINSGLCFVELFLYFVQYLP